MAIETTRWDAAEHLDTPQAIAAYVDAALEEGDPKLVAAALGDAARARGMAALARQTGLSRESLYRARSSDGNPELATVLKVLAAFGVRLEARAMTKRETADA
jgi:probable addiction module antidote protein